MQRVQYLVDRHHVGTPADEVVADVLSRLSDDTPQETKDVVEDFVRKRHEQNLKTYIMVQTGRFE